MTVQTSAMTADLDGDGFAVAQRLIGPSVLGEVLEAIGTGGAELARRGSGFGRRNVLEIPAIAEVAAGAPVRGVVEDVLGRSARVVRGLFFDKTPEANWTVPWHQDRSIAVRDRLEVEGYGPWSVKAGVVHVQPPAEVLRAMLTIRIHLDDCA